jgi:hypothetical protein
MGPVGKGFVPYSIRGSETLTIASHSRPRRRCILHPPFPSTFLKVNHLVEDSLIPTLTSHSSFRPGSLSYSPPQLLSEKNPLAQAIRTICAPFIYPIDAPHFITYEGRNFTMKNPPVWTEPFGKDMCILDVDNRPYSNEHELFDDQHPFHWGSLDTFSSSLLNHYLYGARVNP